jgi:hypothetical protein
MIDGHDIVTINICWSGSLLLETLGNGIKVFKFVLESIKENLIR